MPPRVYKLTVVAGALTWMMFGMSLDIVLRTGAGETQTLPLILAGLWFLLGAGDLWWLLRFGTSSGCRSSDLG